MAHLFVFVWGWVGWLVCFGLFFLFVCLFFESLSKVPAGLISSAIFFL